jgi:ABC-type multidrug transport system permease subunit
VTHNTGVTFLRQLRVLLARGFLNAIRNWIFYWVRIAMLGMLAILSGTIWLNLGHSYASVQNRFGVLFFGVAFCCFMAVAGIPAYLEERGVMLREVHSGYYGPLAYTVASTMIMIPFLAILAMVYSVIAYWLQQLNPSASRFFTFYGIFFLVLFVAEAMMLVWPALVPIFVIALTFASFFNGFVMMLMGYFVVYSSIPKFWIWGYYLSYQMYAFQAVCLNEFAGLTFDCLKSSSTNNTCSCLYVDSLNSQCQFSGDTVMVQYGYDGVCITCWAMVLLGMAIGYRIIFWLILEWRTRAALN